MTSFVPRVGYFFVEKLRSVCMAMGGNLPFLLTALVMFIIWSFTFLSTSKGISNYESGL